MYKTETNHTRHTYAHVHTGSKANPPPLPGPADIESKHAGRNKSELQPGR